ncbi:PAX3- and PAX7-binding protein 1 [Nymphaea thermarum]|nr:PAX3- and PAX7-binding protein 1 [Nymphaea thermarum]
MNRAKNFRRRADNDDDEDGGDSLVIKPPPKPTTKTSAATAAKPKAPSSQPPKRSKLLSFADDEDTSPVASSKSSHKSERHKPQTARSLLSFSADDGGAPASAPHSASRKSALPNSSLHKIVSAKERSTQPSVPSNVQPQAGEYTKEKLLELQKNTRTLGGAKPSLDSKAAEPVVVLKGLVKPSGQEVAPPRKDDAISVEPERDGGVKKLGKGDVDKERDSERDSLIPDQATIDAIRAKRERLRQVRLLPDYISLDGGSGRGVTADTLRDGEGSSDDEMEFHGRIALLGERSESVRKGVFENVDARSTELGLRADSGDVGIGEDDDDEEKRWEEEQFRKGFGKRVDDGSNRGSVPAIPVPGSILQAAQPAPAYTPVGSTASKLVGVTRSLEVMSIHQKAEVATRALEQNFQMLQETYGMTISSMNRTDENLTTSSLHADDLEKSLDAAGERFLFMQKLRDFISVLCDFLQDKASYIEELEEQMQKLHEERASAITERREADAADAMSEVEAAVNAAMTVFKRRGSEGDIVAAANAAQAALMAAREQRSLPVQLDEFGRDVNLQKRMDASRRADARQQRKARSELKRGSNVRDSGFHQYIEGESSTDESDSECSAYKSSCDELLQTAKMVFSDATDDYSKLSFVKERFEGWKKHYFSSYRDAYVSLSAPAIFSPYVRLELLQWDPLHAEADFNDMEWHSLLFNYGMPEDANDFDPADPDADLVPGLIEKVALPILHHEIAHCWDMLSTRESRNAVSATQMIITYVPATSKALQELIIAVQTRLSEAISNLIVPTWTPRVISAVPQAARVAAYCFGVSVRLLRNICLWRDILATTILEQLALDELLNGKVLPHVHSIKSNIHDAVTRVERIIASLSGVWSGAGVRGHSSPKLQPLLECLGSLGKELEKKHASGVHMEEVSGLARRLKKMLVELNEYDRARAVMKTFLLKEAL